MFTRLKCKKGYMTLEAVLIIGVTLLCTLYFTIQLALSLYSAGIEAGMNCYDMATFYHINEGGMVHRYFSKGVNEKAVPIGGIRLYDVERQVINRKFSNHMIDNQVHWQGIANQCTIKVYESLLKKEK